MKFDTNIKKRSQNHPNVKLISQFDIWKIEAAERQKRQREETLKIARQKILDENSLKRKIADEACLRIQTLPIELQFYILHHLEIKQLQLLQLPESTLRAVLQAGEKDGTHAKELVKSTWSKRISDKDDKGSPPLPFWMFLIHIVERGGGHTPYLSFLLHRQDY